MSAHAYSVALERHNSFGSNVDGYQLLDIVGDSNLPTLRPGQKVIYDSADRLPSPPGLFAIWDGLAMVINRVEYIAHSQPPRVKVSCDNRLYATRECPIGELDIRGRIVGSWSRI